MGNRNSPWAFSYSSLAAAAALIALFSSAHADDINTGAPTFIPGQAASSPAVQQRAAGQGINIPAAGGNSAGGVPRVNVPTPDTIPVPSTATAVSQTGQYRNAKGEVKLEKMLLDRYQQSVVSVTARDLAGNELARSMGVGVGRNAQFIAVPLSIVLGNEQQWADKIEITHVAGNKYSAKVALIDEEHNTVLLAPEANPAPLPYVREENERPQITVFTISFQPSASGPRAVIHRGMLAAANLESGLLSVAGSDITDEQAGTGIISTNGELVGMLLPGARGVLASTIQSMVAKAAKATPIEPNRIGTILGRGVIVGGKEYKGAYPTISEALEAIKKGDAPKTDPSLYTPAKNRSVAPKDADKVVVKVMPGIYKEAKTISVPSNLSLSGSGPDRTSLIGTDPNKPVVLVQGEENSLIAGFRIIPAQKQTMKAPTLIVNKSKNVTVLGNVIESRGGISAWALQSTGVRFQGNSFPAAAGSGIRGLSCDRSELKSEANAFIGKWIIGISADKSCDLEINHSLFFSSQTALNISADAHSVKLVHNSFVRNDGAIKLGGKISRFDMADNLFYECDSALNMAGDIEAKRLGRWAIWKTKVVAAGKNVPGLDLVRSEPKFVSPEAYDFRLRQGQAQLSSSLSEPAGRELGAFQFDTFVGTYTQQLVRSLSVATGQPNLAALWGFSAP